MRVCVTNLISIKNTSLNERFEDFSDLEIEYKKADTNQISVL